MSIESTTRSDQFIIKTEPRKLLNGQTKQIYVPIGNLNGLQLSEKNLGKIFDIINKNTINIPYQHRRAPIKVGKVKIHRYNHNGTLAAKQAKLLQVIFKFLNTHGSPTAKKVLTTLTEEERLSLIVGAYICRAGRVDEGSYKYDRFKIRSANIFHAYAKQLNITPKVIEWTKLMILNMCEPSEKRDISIKNNPKNRFGYHTLTMCHDFDLIRCFRRNSFNRKTKPKIRKSLQFLVENTNKIEAFIDRFLKYTTKLNIATGSHLIYHTHSWQPTNPKLFTKCSNLGAYCWQVVDLQTFEPVKPLSSLRSSL